MKNLILIALILFTSTVQAQQFQTAKMDVYCGPGSAIKGVIDRFSEQGFIKAEVERAISANETAVFEVRIFVNPKTKTFTMVEKISEDLYCIIATGNKITPVVEQGEGV